MLNQVIHIGCLASLLLWDFVFALNRTELSEDGYDWLKFTQVAPSTFFLLRCLHMGLLSVSGMFSLSY